MNYVPGCRKKLGWNRACLAAWVVVLGCWAGCVRAPQEPQPDWRQATFGLCEDYPEESRSLEKARRDLAVAKAAGARVLRIAFGWDAMEPERGRYDWTFWDDYVSMAVNEYGITLIPYICYTPRWAATDAGDDFWRSPPRDPEDFARFVEALVRRYGDRIRYWELWNEPDNQAYWLGDTGQFAELVKRGSSAVRRVDPRATVVLGGIAGELDFLGKVLAEHKVGSHVDVVNIHSYYETWHPSPIEHLATYIEGAAGLVRDTGGRHPLWMAETGYSSVGGRAEVSGVYRAHYAGEHTDAAQATALARTALMTLATNEVAVFAWYRINDLVPAQDVIGDDNNRHLGILALDGSPKSAHAAFRFLAHRFASPFTTITPNVVLRASTGPGAVVKAFRFPDERRWVAMWLAMPNEPAAPSPRQDDRRADLQVSVPGFRAGSVRWYDAEGRTLAPERARYRRAGSGTEITCALAGGELVIAELEP